MKRFALLLAGALSLSLAGGVDAKAPPQDILGIHPGMLAAEASRRMARIGSEIGEDQARIEKGKELWQVRDRRLESVAFKYGRSGRVKWVTAFVKKDGRRLRYRDLADPSKGRQVGKYIYEWSVPARGDRPAYVLQARGIDPVFVGSYSMFVPEGPGAPPPAPSSAAGR
jgi:hypothetical protein